MAKNKYLFKIMGQLDQRVCVPEGVINLLRHIRRDSNLTDPTNRYDGFDTRMARDLEYVKTEHIGEKNGQPQVNITLTQEGERVLAKYQHLKHHSNL